MYGWIECVGFVDCLVFDFKVYSDKFKVDLVAYERFDKLIEEMVVEIMLNKKVFGKVFKKDVKFVMDVFFVLSEVDVFVL